MDFRNFNHFIEITTNTALCFPKCICCCVVLKLTLITKFAVLTKYSRQYDDILIMWSTWYMDVHCNNFEDDNSAFGFVWEIIYNTMTIHLEIDGSLPKDYALLWRLGLIAYDNYEPCECLSVNGTRQTKFLSSIPHHFPWKCMHDIFSVLYCGMFH